jgi:WD40 repeat protein
LQGNAFTSFGGHSSFVTAVRFMPDDQRLLSTGGNDKCIFQWVVKRQ